MRRPLGPRLRREQRTLAAMAGIYCRDHHRGGADAVNLCEECADFLAAARHRLEHCPFGESKHACLDCRVGCHPKDLESRLRAVTGHAGPKLWWSHPWLAWRRFLDDHLLHRAPDASTERRRSRRTRGG